MFYNLRARAPDKKSVILVLAFPLTCVISNIEDLTCQRSCLNELIKRVGANR